MRGKVHFMQIAQASQKMNNEDSTALTHVLVGKVILKEAEAGREAQAIEQFTHILGIVGATLESLHELGFKLVKA
jgi:hypothetical protein